MPTLQGWSRPGEVANPGRYRLDLKKGWLSPGDRADPGGHQFVMGPDFDPRLRSAGWSVLASPPGTEAPVNRLNYTPDSREVTPPGQLAPVDKFNLSLLPDTSPGRAPEVISAAGGSDFGDMTLEEATRRLIEALGLGAETGGNVGAGQAGGGWNPATGRFEDAYGRPRPPLPGEEQPTPEPTPEPTPSSTPEPRNVRPVPPPVAPGTGVTTQPAPGAAVGPTPATSIAPPGGPTGEADTSGGANIGTLPEPVPAPEPVKPPAPPRRLGETWEVDEGEKIFGEPVLTRYVQEEEGPVRYGPTEPYPIYRKGQLYGFVNPRTGAINEAPRQTRATAAVKPGDYLVDAEGNITGQAPPSPLSPEIRTIPYGPNAQQVYTNGVLTGVIPATARPLGSTNLVAAFGDPAHPEDATYLRLPVSFTTPGGSLGIYEPKTEQVTWVHKSPMENITKDSEGNYVSIAEDGTPTVVYRPQKRFAQALETATDIMLVSGEGDNVTARSIYTKKPDKKYAAVGRSWVEYDPASGETKKIYEEPRDLRVEGGMLLIPGERHTVVRRDNGVTEEFNRPGGPAYERRGVGEGQEAESDTVRKEREAREYLQKNTRWDAAPPDPLDPLRRALRPAYDSLVPPRPFDPGQYLRARTVDESTGWQPTWNDRTGPLTQEDWTYGPRLLPMTRVGSGQGEGWIPRESPLDIWKNPNYNAVLKALNAVQEGSAAQASQAADYLRRVKATGDPVLADMMESLWGLKERAGQLGTDQRLPVHLAVPWIKQAVSQIGNPLAHSANVQLAALSLLPRAVFEKAFEGLLPQENETLGVGQGQGPGQGWQPPVSPSAVVGTGNRFGDQASVEGFHKGTDLQAYRGTPAVAPISGTVVDTPDDPQGLGLQVLIRDDATGEVHTLAHLDTTLVQVGDKVTAGQPVGLVGSTGNSTGPHLDYRIQDQTGNYENPEQLTGPLSALPDASGQPAPQGRKPRGWVPTGAGQGRWNIALPEGPEGGGSWDAGTPWSSEPQPPSESPPPTPRPSTRTTGPLTPTTTGGAPGAYHPGIYGISPGGSIAPWGNTSPWAAPYTGPAVLRQQTTAPNPDQSTITEAQRQMIAAQRYAADRQYAASLNAAESNWRIHQDDDRFRQEALQAEVQWRQARNALDERLAQLQFQSQQLQFQSQQLDRQLNIAQSALKNPWLQNLTGMAPGWGEPGSPQSIGQLMIRNTSGLPAALPSAPTGGGQGRGWAARPVYHTGAGQSGGEWRAAPEYEAISPGDWTGGFWAGGVDTSTGVPIRRSIAPETLQQQFGPNVRFEDGKVFLRAPEETSPFAPGGRIAQEQAAQGAAQVAAQVGQAMGGAPSTNPQPVNEPLMGWEPYQAMDPFRRAALRTRLELTGPGNWEKFVNNLRNKWGTEGGPTSLGTTSWLSQLNQTPRQQLGQQQLVETFGEKPSEYQYRQRAGWAPAQASSVSIQA